MRTIHRVLNPNMPAQVPGDGCALAVMTKAPRAGMVKTRLVPPLTQDEAAKLNRSFLRDIADGISSAIGETATKRDALGIGVYNPPGTEADYGNILPEEFCLIPQRGDHFGDRLIFAAEDLFKV